METVNFNEVVEEFKTTAEVRALIVLNGLGKKTPTLDEWETAIVHCACISPYIGPADCADWRIFTVEIGSDFNNVHLPNWLVDTALKFVTDDELDTLIAETPIENWIAGLGELARTAPPGYAQRIPTIELCKAIESAGKDLPEEHRQKVQKAVTDKVKRVREQKAAAARGETVDDNRDIRVAIIGL